MTPAIRKASEEWSDKERACECHDDHLREAFEAGARWAIELAARLVEGSITNPRYVGMFNRDVPPLMAKDIRDFETVSISPAIPELGKR